MLTLVCSQSSQIFPVLLMHIQVDLSICFQSLFCFQEVIQVPKLHWSAAIPFSFSLHPARSIFCHFSQHLHMRLAKCHDAIMTHSPYLLGSVLWRSDRLSTNSLGTWSSATCSFSESSASVAESSSSDTVECLIFARALLLKFCDAP